MKKVFYIAPVTEYALFTHMGALCSGAYVNVDDVTGDGGNPDIEAPKRRGKALIVGL